MNRRNFLGFLSLLALQACSTNSLTWVKSGKRRKFYVPSPKYYLNLNQDFSAIKFEKKLTSPSNHIPGDYVTHLSVIEDETLKVRKILLPGLVHSVVADSQRAYALPTDGQSWIYSLHPESLEMDTFVYLNEDEYAFGGHAILLPDGENLAITQNSRQIGKFDRVSIRNRHTLKEVGSVNSYGFEAHDISFSKDGKSLYIGHYGSHLGSGPYHGMVTKEFRDTGKDMTKTGQVAYETKYKNIYPGSVTTVELSSGKLLDRKSSVDSGAHCHFVVDSEENIYLPHFPSLIESRKDVFTNTIFNEGVHGGEQVESFLPRMQAGYGTSIAYDPKNKQIIIPSRWVESINHLTQDNPGKLQTFTLGASLSEMKMTHGLIMHPDGRHYVVTGNNWFATFEAQNHKWVKERSFGVELFIHAHTNVG